VTTALLMFQLAIGLQWQVAHAIAAPPEWQASGMDARHCPVHPAPSSHDNPAHKHDCCGSLDCQCTFAQGPAVLDLPPSRVVLPASFLLSFVNARPPVARTNEVFRPPIA